MTEIATQRLRLRPAVAADLAAVHAILSDARATAYWSTLPHQTVEQSRAWLGSMIDIPADQGEDFVVEHEGRVIGKAGLYRFPEIGSSFIPMHGAMVSPGKRSVPCSTAPSGFMAWNESRPMSIRATQRR